MTALTLIKITFIAVAALVLVETGGDAFAALGLSEMEIKVESRALNVLSDYANNVHIERKG